MEDYMIDALNLIGCALLQLCFALVYENVSPVLYIDAFR